MNESPVPRATPVTRRRVWRFAVVLVAALLLVGAEPLTSGLADRQSMFHIFFSLLIGAVLLVVFEEKEYRRIAVSTAIAAVVATWVSHGLDGWPGRLVLVGGYLLAVCLLALALFGILRRVFAKHTSGGALFGAVCGYLLLGIIWGVLFAAVETAVPESFRLPASGGAEDIVVSPDPGTLNYFSFVTLATLGYGDVTPVTPIARTLSWMEAITGQLYLAILVAGLVGFKVTQAFKD